MYLAEDENYLSMLHKKEGFTDASKQVVSVSSNSIKEIGFPQNLY